MGLEPSEEEFDFPTMEVNLDNLLCKQVPSIGNDLVYDRLSALLSGFGTRSYLCCDETHSR